MESSLACETDTSPTDLWRLIQYPTKYLPGMLRNLGMDFTSATDREKHFLATESGMTQKLRFLQRQ